MLSPKIFKKKVTIQQNCYISNIFFLEKIKYFRYFVVIVDKQLSFQLHKDYVTSKAKRV